MSLGDRTPDTVDESETWPNRDNEPSFKEKQEQHFRDILGKKWECPRLGHTVCVPTVDGRHFQLSEEDLTAWVKALCDGETSTAQPPHGVLAEQMHFLSWSHQDRDGSSVPEAVSLAPSRRRNATSRSRNASSVDASTSSSSASSGVPGVGYYGGKAIKWLGVRSINTLEDLIAFHRAAQHLSRLKFWQRRKGDDVGDKKRRKLLYMLEDALEMSRPCYSRRINMYAYEIGREVQRWLQSYPGIPRTDDDDAFWICRVHVCLLPLLLARIARDQPLVGDLACELLEALTRVPLEIEGSGTTEAVIRIVTRELAYSPYSFQHSWLGVDLRRIIQITLSMRVLTLDEMGAIHALAARRLEQRDHQEPGLCRPWEVAIIADCALQDPKCKEVVLGEHGLQSLLSALDSILAIPGLDECEELSLILRALAFLSEHEWLADAIEPAITSLLHLFRYIIPEKWFCIRFWAVDTIRTIVSHRPSKLRTLIEENARPALLSLVSAPIPQEFNRMGEDYRREASNCANDLLRQIEEWSEDSMTMRS